MTTIDPTATPDAPRTRHGLDRQLRLYARTFSRNGTAMVGLAIVVIFLLVAAFAPWLAPYPEDAAGKVNLAQKLMAPSAAHWFGTDEVGNDILSRILIGARTSLRIGLTVTLIAAAIGVPLGIAAGHRPWLDTALRPVLDLMQTLPTFVYLIPTLVLFGLGVVPGLVSTVIFALPAPIRLTQLGIAQVPPSLVEAARAFGATRWQVLTKIELPHALPTILAGVNQCILLSLSMVVIAALVGAGGLGAPVVRALNTVNIGLGFEAGAAIVLLAIVLARVVQPPKPRRKP